MILSFINFWVIDVYILDPHPDLTVSFLYPVVRVSEVYAHLPLLGELGEHLLTCVVGMMLEVHACMLQLAEGVQPLVIQPVHHIHPTSGWLHNQLTFQTIRHPSLEVPNCFISNLNIESIISLSLD